MTTAQEESRLIRRVYAGALQRDPEEREEYLARECANRPALRAKVAALLEAHSQDFIHAAGDLTPNPHPDHPREDMQGRVIGSYIIRREIGRGGMGIVYLADDTRLSRRVALKAITPAVGREASGRERLRLEARAAARLSHPGIATVYALEEIDDEMYLVCEFVPGEPLRTLVRSGALPIDAVVEIGTQLARALAAAHAQGIVHRDIKPENIVRTPSGIVKILDFGLARVEGSASMRLTQSGIILGTPAYLAPEQALGVDVDFRTDLFALGLLLYELASGVNPFATATITSTIARIIEHDPAPLSSVQPASVPELDRIVATCLRKDPLERYPSTPELVADLERLGAELSGARRAGSHGGSSTSAPLDRRQQPTPRWWWDVHQLAMSAVYVMMLYPAWYARAWLPQPWETTFLLVVLASVTAAVSLRLHLLFIARSFPNELPAQYAWAAPRTRWCDVGFAVPQILAAAIIGGTHPEFAMLFVGVSTATLVASLVIEPATARAALGSRTHQTR